MLSINISMFPGKIHLTVSELVILEDRSELADITTTIADKFGALK